MNLVKWSPSYPVTSGELPITMKDAPIRHPPPRSSPPWKTLLVNVTLGVIFTLYMTWSLSPDRLDLDTLLSDSEQGVCQQIASLNLTDMVGGASIPYPGLRETVERHSQAVQIDTTVGDAWPDPDKDDTFGVKGSPHLRPGFATRSRVKREVIHQAWSAVHLARLGPLSQAIALTGAPGRACGGYDARRMDVSSLVRPIDIERQTIWGRGAMDCKQFLIGIMSSVDMLIANGFQPKRTVLLSFGFDEE